MNEFHLNYAVAIRNNHGVWLPQSQSVRQKRWRAFERIFSDGTKQKRYIREVIFGKRREIQYWLITTDPDKLPENSTWYVMTKIPGVKFQKVGNLDGLRNWVEYGLKQSKNELGWADFRVTDYDQIQKWWELVMSAYLMVSLHSKALNPAQKLGNDPARPNLDNIPSKFATHEWWDTGIGWKNLLNNLRLIIQPFVLFNLLKPWLKVFSIEQLSFGFSQLIALMNSFRTMIPNPTEQDNFSFSSA